MKICIDISQAVYPRGVGRYTRELVTNLLKIDQKTQYILFGSSLRQQKFLNNFINSLKAKSSKLEAKVYPIPPTILEFLFNKVHLSIDPFVGKVDVFHSSDWTQPKSSAKKITTIHDMIVYKFPQLFDKKTISVQKARLAWVKKEVDKIIAVSQNTKKDIIETLQIPEKKIVVIYEAASAVFYPRSENEVKTATEKFGIKKDYILTVNTRSSQKLAKLLEAFENIKKDFDIELAVVGESVNYAENLINIGLVDDEELARLYSGAKVFVYPSIYEGFGLPVLEVMACGVPVVCSNTSSLPEVAGGAGVYVDPNSENEIAEGVKKVLMNKKFTQELLRQSLVQTARFSWEEAAKQTVKVYEEVFKS